MTVPAFPGGSAVKNLPTTQETACNAGDVGLIPGLGRSPGVGSGNPLQYSCLENPMDRGAWLATVHGVTWVGHDLVTKLPPAGCWEPSLFHLIVLIHSSPHLYSHRYEENSFSGGSVIKNPPAKAGDVITRCGFYPWVRKIPWRRAWQPTHSGLLCPWNSPGKNTRVSCRTLWSVILPFPW